VPAHPQPEADADEDIFTQGNVRRLRLVGFPKFMAATFTEGDLSGFYPAGAGGVGGQAVFGDVKSVSVEVTVAESYGLPYSMLAPELLKLKRPAAEMARGADDDLPGLDAETADLGTGAPPAAGQGQPPVEGPLMLTRPTSAAGASPDAAEDAGQAQAWAGSVQHPFTGIGVLLPEDTRRRRIDGDTEVELVRLCVAAEVFYARAVDITIQTRRDRGGALQWMRGALGRGGSSDGEHTEPAPDGLEPNAPTADNAPGPGRHLQALQQAREGVPGGSVRVLSVSENMVGMRRIYDRPVAIGFRGFDFVVSLDAETGEFLDMEVVGASLSSIPRDL
jgi:hypothetical protein